MELFYYCFYFNVIVFFQSALKISIFQFYTTYVKDCMIVQLYSGLQVFSVFMWTCLWFIDICTWICLHLGIWSHQPRVCKKSIFMFSFRMHKDWQEVIPFRNQPNHWLNAQMKPTRWSKGLAKKGFIFLLLY